MDNEIFWDELKSGKFVSMVKESSRGKELIGSTQVYNVLKPLFAEEDDVEQMYFIFMDQKNKIIAIENHFKGSISKSAVYPRELVKRVLQLKANNIVMAHNHPSGDPFPSPEDRSLTLWVILALNSIDVSILDHIIIGNSYYSMCDEGVLQPMKEKVSNFIKGIQ
jgi:DNA repair protein RadC